MAGEMNLTVVGTLTGDPELKFLASGKAVANFTIAQNPRVKDGNEWKDGDPTFIRCNAWEGMAENVVESLHKGDRVIVQGGLYSRSWEDKEGNKRSALELRIEAVGPDLRYATAAVTKIRKGGGGFQQAAPAADPWATAAVNDPPF
jgi:single-strand DNA-binding protein